MTNPEVAAQLVAKWRASRKASDAEALVGLEREHQAPRGKTEFHRAWLDIASNADALDVGWLTRTIFERLPEHMSEHDRRSPSWIERIEALRPHAPDPRISAAVLRVILEAPFTSASQNPFEPYGSVSALITADVRQVRVIEKWLRSPRGRSSATRRALLMVGPQWIGECKRLGVDDLGPIAAPIGSTPIAPIDDAARSVFADTLIEQNNPRGEFIALQRAHTTSAARQARALLKKHKEEWFGELNRVLLGHQFEDGFLVQAALTHAASAEDSVWRKAVMHPELRGLKRLLRGRGNATRYIAFLNACPWLEDVEVGGPEVAEALLSISKRPLKRVAFTAMPSQALLNRFAEPSNFPALRHFAFTQWFAEDSSLARANELLKRTDTIELSMQATHQDGVLFVPAIRHVLPSVKRVLVANAEDAAVEITRRDGRLHFDRLSGFERFLETVIPALDEPVTVHVEIDEQEQAARFRNSMGSASTRLELAQK